MSSLLAVKINPEDVKKSRAWFDGEIRKISEQRFTPAKTLKTEGVRLQSRIVPGKMYFFYYDPKTKETLPYYDTFPLVIPYKKVPGGFMGLNLHYLEYQPRMKLFNELLKITGNKHLTEISKIKYSWQIVSSVSQLAPAQACVKRYLIEQVGSPFAEVNPEFWHTAVMLPVQRFVGARKERVWTESRKFR